MAHFINFFLSLTSGMGYWGVFILMTIESSFLPLPSELVIPPAAYLAFKGEMNIFVVILLGSVGSVAGALINYFLAKTLGRRVIYRLVKSEKAKYIFLNEEKLAKVENFFLKHGNWSTFLGRLVPVVRHLISIPAGFVKMKMGPFVLLTFSGSIVWVSILAALGYYFGANQELILKYAKEIGWGFVGLGALVMLWFAFKGKGEHEG